LQNWKEKILTVTGQPNQRNQGDFTD